MEGTYSSAIMSPWGCFICLAMAASASSTYRSFSESDTFCKATSRCSGCRPSCSPARSCESHKKGLGGGGRWAGTQWAQDRRGGRRRGAEDRLLWLCPVPPCGSLGWEGSSAEPWPRPAQPRGDPPGRQVNK